MCVVYAYLLTLICLTHVDYNLACMYVYTSICWNSGSLLHMYVYACCLFPYYSISVCVICLTFCLFVCFFVTLFCIIAA